MEVEMDDGRIVKIDGELLIGGFAANSNSIREWKKPAGVPIDEETKAYIIEKVLEKSKEDTCYMKFYFD
ncbi:MAG: hypothetical protein KH334_03245 [Clostridiales bacterium]|nr:hypothetical protein [Clostridiales bacterium]